MDKQGFNGATFNIGLMITGKNKKSYSTIGRDCRISFTFLLPLPGALLEEWRQRPLRTES